MKSRGVEDAPAAARETKLHDLGPSKRKHAAADHPCGVRSRLEASHPGHDRPLVRVGRKSRKLSVEYLRLGWARVERMDFARHLDCPP